MVVFTKWILTKKRWKKLLLMVGHYVKKPIAWRTTVIILFAFTDVDDFCVKVFNPVTKEVFVLVGEGCGTCDGSKTQFAQPTGLCLEMKTLFVVDTSTGLLRMTSSAKSLLSYLKHLEMFAVTFELHIRKDVPVAISLQDAIDRVQMVYAFDKKCVDDVKALTGTSATTQGPQGTVSLVVIDDEKRLLNSLKEIKQLLDLTLH